MAELVTSGALSPPPGISATEWQRALGLAHGNPALAKTITSTWVKAEDKREAVAAGDAPPGQNGDGSGASLGIGLGPVVIGSTIFSMAAINDTMRLAEQAFRNDPDFKNASSGTIKNAANMSTAMAMTLASLNNGKANPPVDGDQAMKDKIQQTNKAVEDMYRNDPKFKEEMDHGTFDNNLNRKILSRILGRDPSLEEMDTFQRSELRRGLHKFPMGRQACGPDRC